MQRFRADTSDVFFPLYEVWGSPKRGGGGGGVSEPPWIRRCNMHLEKGPDSRIRDWDFTHRTEGAIVTDWGLDV